VVGDLLQLGQDKVPSDGVQIRMLIAGIVLLTLKPLNSTMKLVGDVLCAKI
jgi:hypothetical protein